VFQALCCPSELQPPLGRPAGPAAAGVDSRQDVALLVHLPALCPDHPGWNPTDGCISNGIVGKRGWYHRCSRACGCNRSEKLLHAHHLPFPRGRRRGEGCLRPLLQPGCPSRETNRWEILCVHDGEVLTVSVGAPLCGGVVVCGYDQARKTILKLESGDRRRSKFENQSHKFEIVIAAQPCTCIGNRT
jgi:hypothetical protein